MAPILFIHDLKESSSKNNQAEPSVEDHMRSPIKCSVCGQEIKGNPIQGRPSGPVCSPACLNADYGRRYRCLGGRR
jgi:hypothetical protein